MRTWQLVEPRHQSRLEAPDEKFGHARSEGRGSDDIAQGTKAVEAGRVATLLNEARQEISDQTYAATDDIQLDRLTLPEVDDVLDDLATSALTIGGHVVVVPTEQMPTKTGIIAIYRY